MKSFYFTRNLLLVPVVAAALTSLSIEEGAQAKAITESNPVNIINTPATDPDSLDKPIKGRGWLAIDKVGRAESNDPDIHRVTLLGSLPTPCHALGWEIPSGASADGLLHIQAWSINTGQICVQALHPFHAELSFLNRPFEKVAVNGVIADEQTDLMKEALALPEFPTIRWIRSDETSTITPANTPGPLPLAAALAGWHSARRLRSRCQAAKARTTA